MEDSIGAEYTNLVGDPKMEEGVSWGRNWLVGAPHTAKMSVWRGSQVSKTGLLGISELQTGYFGEPHDAKNIGFCGRPQECKIESLERCRNGSNAVKNNPFGGDPNIAKQRVFWRTTRVRTGILGGPSAAKMDFLGGDINAVELDLVGKLVLEKQGLLGNSRNAKKGLLGHPIVQN